MASTTEPGGETQEVSGDVFTTTLSYKIWVLRVSLHCEACGKMVSKLLKEIDGVYITEFDLEKQRVTVLGNVEAEALIKFLKKKTKKRFQVIWPEPQANPRDEVQSKPQAQERQSAPKPKPSQGGDGGGGGIKIREPQTCNLPRQSPPPVVAEKQSGGGEKESVEVKSGGADGNAGGGGKKKGNEQNVNVNDVAEGETRGVAPSTGSPPVQTGPLPQPQPQPQGHPNVQTTIPGVQRAMPVPPYHVPQPQVYDHSNNPRQQSSMSNFLLSPTMLMVPLRHLHGSVMRIQMRAVSCDGGLELLVVQIGTLWCNGEAKYKKIHRHAT